MISDNDNDRI